jgi:hypothetical protein
MREKEVETLRQEVRLQSKCTGSKKNHTDQTEEVKGLQAKVKR